MSTFTEAVKRFFTPNSVKKEVKDLRQINARLDEMVMQFNSIPGLTAYGAIDQSLVQMMQQPGDNPDAKLAAIFSELRNVKTDVNVRYLDYAKMLGDGITRAAVKLFVDDATQFDPVRESIIWVESVDSKWAEETNSFLKNRVKSDKIAKSIAFYTAAYGDSYLNTFLYDEEYKKTNMIGSFFEVTPPVDLVELQRYGKTVGFFKFNKKAGSNNSSRYRVENQFDRGDSSANLYKTGSYIHFSLNQGFMSERFVIEGTDITGSPANEEYNSIYGESLLEAARADFALRQFYDFLILLARYNKSTFYRMFGIEVKDSSERQAAQIIENFKQQIMSRQSYDSLSGYLNLTNAPMMTGGNVYYAMREGKGQISVQEVGQMQSQINLDDVNYFDDRYFGALAVPKQFLGQAKELPGGLGDSTMTRLDVKYGRTVKSLQMAIKNGFYDLIIWKSSNIDHKAPPPFVVKMVPVVTADEVEKERIHGLEIERSGQLLDLIDRLGLTEDDNFNREAVIKHLVTKLSADPFLENKLFNKNMNNNDDEEEDAD